MSHRGSHGSDPYASFKAFAKKRGMNLSPEQIAIIAAILTNSLRVQSILLDKDKTVQILLQGNVAGGMDELMREIRHMPVGDILDSLFVPPKQ
ncbi:hypothetical protein [Bacillus alkalicellulosilyticus]|uniref:hypothetical protein n=1 Tax=Alkalihalobacterium alkalicellulosilyticum TaxID=1912214 RepID=UPI0009982CF8|nr:hypothetical protein [Bacillus alkalicellulosilyticus]